MEKEFYKYLKYIDKNIKIDGKGKKVVLTGASGSIGGAIASYLSYLKFDLILLVRNINSVAKKKEELETLFHNKIELLEFDYLNLGLVKDALNKINFKSVSYFINVSGIYHQKIEKITIGGSVLTKELAVNLIMPSFFISKIVEINPTIKVINTASISYKFNKIDLNDIFGYELNNKTSRYGISKRLLMIYSIYLKRKGYDVRLIHPGISYTNLFKKKNNAYNNFFYIFISPLMKLIFLNPYKASLSALYLMNFNDIKENFMAGPRGLFNAFGYPSLNKINEDLLSEVNEEKVIFEMDKLIKGIE